MPLGLSDLDPEIAERLKAKDLEVRRFSRLGVMETARRALAKDETASRAFAAEVRLQDAIQAEHAEAKQKDARELIKLRKSLRYWILLLSIFGIAIFILSYNFRYAMRNYIFYISLIIICIFLPFQLKIMNYYHVKDIGSWISEKPRTVIPTTTIVALLQAVGRDEVETAYGESAAAVLEASDILGEITARELLSALNDLLAAARRLEDEKSALDAAMAGQSLAQIEAERDGLQARIEASSDTVAKETLTESIKQCEARLVRARGLAPLQERIDAQLLGISQTMRSVQSSVASLKLAPSTSADLDALRETARELAGRTRAIEDAVREVISIRS